MTVQLDAEPRTWADLQLELVSLAQRVAALDIRPFESLSAGTLAVELAPRVGTLLAEAQALVVQVTFACDLAPSSVLEPSHPGTGSLPSHFSFAHSLDAALGSPTVWSLEAVSDVAFLAGLELRQRAERLRRVEPTADEQSLLGECDGALRRIRKALSSIDQGLARAGVASPVLDYASEMHVSLRVRRLYAGFRRNIEAIGTPADEDLPMRLRVVAGAIAAVVGWPGYSELRVRDRLELRSLQTRLLGWFRGIRDPAEAQRLWRDVTCFVEMLADVNLRQELREHDTRLGVELWERISREKGVLPTDLMNDLRRLEGAAGPLDELLLRGEERAESWHGPLGDLVTVLTRGRRGPQN